ncbi:unnamed protein product, partial [Discosporangium mesarthrocarpum]
MAYICKYIYIYIHEILRPPCGHGMESLCPVILLWCCTAQCSTARWSYIVLQYFISAHCCSSALAHCNAARWRELCCTAVLIFSILCVFGVPYFYSSTAVQYSRRQTKCSIYFQYTVFLKVC